ncbi:MAG: hypothetical protein APR63_06930 [Desulfuromonas sp. SDB]|nr:MAG: hypothetical protein APR63_06930 [Desulfuromonas sp. SDB]
MNHKPVSEEFYLNIIPYVLSAILLIFSFSGLVFDYSQQHHSRLGLVIMFGVGVLILIGLFFKTRRDFYKPIKTNAVVLLTSVFIFITQLSGGILWNLYFPLVVLITFRAKKKDAYMGLIIIAAGELGSSLFSATNSFSIRIFQLLFLGLTVESLIRILSFRVHFIKKEPPPKDLTLPELDRVDQAEKISKKSINYVLDLIFRNPRVRTVVLMFLENTIDGIRLKMVDFRSALPGSISSNPVKPGGSIVGLTLKENDYFLVENFSRSSTSIGYYQDVVAIGSFCGVPLKFKDNYIGILAMDSDEQGAFDAERAYDLTLFAKLLSDMLQISSYLEKKELSSTSLELINDLSHQLIHCLYLGDVIKVFSRKIKESLSFDDFIIAVQVDYNAVRILKSGFNMVKMYKPDEIIKLDENSILKIIVKNNMSMVEKNFHKPSDVQRFLIEPNDGSINIASFAAVPIPSKEDTMGAVLLLSSYLNNFTHRDLELLDVFSILLGAALERSRLYEEKEKLAIKDGLTGLFNHRFLQEILDEEISRGQRSNKPLSFIIIDLDHFKNVNDTYGHRAGDKVLKTIARFITDSVRKFDFVGRYGGEELALVLPDCTNRQALIVAEKIRSGIENLEIEVDQDKILTVTVSIGVSSYPLRAVNKEDLIEDADRSLYVAKQKGRNKIAYSGSVQIGIVPDQ